MASNNCPRQFDHRINLGARIRGHASVRQRHVVSAVYNLDADRSRVQIHISLPARATRMPGAHVIRYELIDVAIVIDHVVRRNLSLLQPHPRKCRWTIFHAGIVQHQHIYWIFPLILIGGWCVDDLHVDSFR